MSWWAAAEVQGAPLRDGKLAVLESGAIQVSAGEAGADLLILGGEPLDAPIVRYGPFVMNSEAELVDAIRAYNAGRFGRINQEKANA